MFVKCRYICNLCQNHDEEDGKRLPDGCFPIKSGGIAAFKAYKIVNNRENEKVKICSQIRKEVEHADRLLKDVRHLRNAAAHNSCFLNDLRIPAGNGNGDAPSPIVTEGMKAIFPALQAAIPDLTVQKINKAMKNARLRQLYSVLFAHRLFVKSRKIREKRWIELKRFIDERLNRNRKYYEKCAPIVKTFDLLKNTVDILARD